MFWAVFPKIKVFLLRDLYSRRPGRILRWDGTFKLVRKLMTFADDPAVKKVLLLIAGEYGHILSYAFAKGEGREEWQIMHFFLHRRCSDTERCRVIGGYDDLGSGTSIKTTNHWFPRIWENVKRPPGKDPFHGIKLVTDSTYGASHDLHKTCCGKVTNVLMTYDKKSLEETVKQYSKKNNVPIELARKTVTTETTWKSKIYNKTRPIAEQKRAAERARDELQAIDYEMQEEGHPPYFKLDNGKRIGTQTQFKYFISHIERGDYQDPLKCKQMSFEAKAARATNADFFAKKRKRTVGDDNDDVGMSALKRRRGTNGLESSNKLVNNVAIHMTRLTEHLAEALLLL